MSLGKKPVGGGGDFTPVPAGQYVARCISLIDLGTQDGEYAGEKFTSEKIMVFWELLETTGGDKVFMDDAGTKPYTVLKEYTHSYGENSNLYGDLSTWFGEKFTDAEDFNISDLLGEYCQIQIMHKKNTKGYVRAIVNGVFTYAGKTKPEGINELQAFDISEPDMDVLDKQLQFVQDKVKMSHEWKQRSSGAAAKEAVDSSFADDVDESAIQDMPDDFLKPDGK